MRILVDGMNLSLPQGTGIATYARNFVVQAESLGLDTDLLVGGSRFNQGQSLNRWGWLSASGAPRGPRRLAHVRRLCGAVRTMLFPNVIELPVTASATGASRVFHVEELFANAVAAFRRFGRMTQLELPGIAVAHWTAPIPIRVKNALNIYTIHDLVPLKFPELVIGDAKQFENLCKSISKSADHIITVSDCSRDDIINILGVDQNIVTNTYQTLGAEFWEDCLNNGGRHQPILPLPRLEKHGYFLFYGSIEPKKNVARILEAHDHHSVGLPLVIVGSPGWGSAEELQRIAQYADQGDGRLHFVEHLPRQQLMALIRAAAATVFPSLYEGFGLPALESMALGTAVIAGNRGSLPEVVGSGGLLVDPASVDEIRQAMIRIEVEKGLRQELARLGREQAKKFAPDAYRTRLNSLFERMMFQQ